MSVDEKSRKQPSVWEWAPVPALLLLAYGYWSGEGGSALSRFCFWVGIGLVPGLAWRVLGKPSWNVHRIFFAFALVLFVLENPELRPDAFTARTVAEHWILVLIGFAVSFTQPAWGMLRTHRLLIDSGVSISCWDTFKLCLSGSFFNIFLPGSTGGDAYRVYAIAHGYQQKLAPALASITLDRFLGLPSLILVVLFGMVIDYQFFASNRILSRLVPFIVVTGAVCLGLVGYLAMAGRSHRNTERDGQQSAVPEGGRPGWIKRAHTMIATNVTRPGTLWLALFYGFMAHIACIVSCLCFGLAVGVEGVPPFRYFLIVPMAMTINSIPGAPGGVGQGELAMATLLTMASPGDANAQAGVMVMLLFRLTNMLMGIAGGIFYGVGKLGRCALGPVPCEPEETRHGN